MAQAELQSDLEVTIPSYRSTGIAGVLQLLNRWPVIPGTILGVLLVVAIFAPLVSPHDPYSNNLKARNHPPIWTEGGSTEYLLGADVIGRDLLSRLIYGARISLMVMAVALITGTIVGTALGLIAGYFGGLIDEVIMRLVDIFLGIPFVLMAMAVAVVMGASFGLLKKPKKQRQSCRTVFTMCLFGGVQRPSICSAPLIIHIGS